jgi:hypothetical protein
MQEANSQQPSVTLETSDKSTFLFLKTPEQMWGKTYVITVQAINLKGKLSLLSDPANFTVGGN